MAYADDTTWIARSKEDLQKIVDISSEFYELNDIEINSKKSELLVLNRKSKGTENKERSIITIGKKKEQVYAKKSTDAIRHLGVWIMERNSQNHNINIVKNEVNKMCNAIKWKRASVSQLIYLNNSVLLPSIEYRLQTTFLSKAVCDRIQKLI